MDDLCPICDSSVLNTDKGLSCETCGKWHHIKCVEVPLAVYNHMAKNDQILWLCKDHIGEAKDRIKKDCTLKEQIISSLAEVKMEIKCLQGAVNIQESSVRTFAETVKMSKSHSNGVVIIPSEGNSSAVSTEQVVREKIDLIKIKTGVTTIKNLKGAGVFLGTKSIEDSKKLENEARMQFGDSYRVYQPKPRLPELLITNVDREYSDDELMLEIRETNYGFSSCDKIKIVHSKNFEGKWKYTIQAIPDTFAKMVNRYITINYREHYIKEHVSLLRCYKCQQYNHKGNSCTSESICARCAKPHKTSECPKKVSYSCINCREANKKGSRFDTNHSCGSKSCGFHQSLIEVKKSKINYSANPSW